MATALEQFGGPAGAPAPAQAGLDRPYEVGTPPGTSDKPEQQSFGECNQKLPDYLQKCLRQLCTEARREAGIARREEVKRILQARRFWKGLQLDYWDSVESRWKLPWEAGGWAQDEARKDEPRYSFVTNYFQAFGLSIIAPLSQDVPPTRMAPQSSEQQEDRDTAEAANVIIELAEHNNRMDELMIEEAFYLFCDGKVGAFVRYVVDGERFGYHPEDEMEARQSKLGQDVYECPGCGHETAAESAEDSLLGGAGMCEQCGQPLGEENLRQAELVEVPQVQRTIQMPNGAELVTLVGGLELITPPWANSFHEFPWLGWETEGHKARLCARYPWAAAKLRRSAGGSENESSTYGSYERGARLGLSTNGQGQGPTQGEGDAGHNLLTFERWWLKPECFELLEDDRGKEREQLKQLFPAGCYVAFCGEVYLESRNEAMVDHWRTMNALPGDGQDRPAIGTSFIPVQQRINTVDNLAIEVIEHGIPATFAAGWAIDFESWGEQTVEPGATYPSEPPPGAKVSDGFYETEPARLAGDVVSYQRELTGPVGQFLTGAFPALYGGDTGKDTVGQDVIQREQALGRVGLVWRRMKWFHADIAMLLVECFRRNRIDDVEVAVFGSGGQKSKWVRQADLKGHVYAYPDTDEQYPVTWAAKKATLERLLASPDPKMQEILGHPENIALIKRLIGLEEFVVPDEEARQKQHREIERLLEDGLTGAGPVELVMPDPLTGQAALDPVTGEPQVELMPSLPIDELLDSHEVEFEVIQRWANSEQGQAAKEQNPAGYANVRAHGLAHQQVLAQQAMQAAMVQAQQRAQPIGGGNRSERTDETRV